MKELLKKVKEIYKTFKFGFIMIIITFLIALLFVYMSSGDDFSYRIIIILIGFVPCFLYFIITLLYNIFKNKRLVIVFLLVINSWLTICLIWYYIAAIFVCSFIEEEHPVKNIKYYNTYITKDLYKAFPKTVPKNVRNIELLYSPGVLQASTVYSLYYIDDNLDIESFDKMYKNKSEWIGKRDDYQEKKGLLLDIFSMTVVDDKDEDDFLIYLIESKCDNSGYCNHGNFMLVAVNTNTKEVIHKASFW